MTTHPLIRKSEASSLQIVLTLTLTAFIAGLAVAGIYEITLPTITANRARELRSSVFEVVPGAQRMTAHGFVDGAWNEENDTGDVVYAAYGDGDALLGYAIPGKGPGYQDAISLIFGFDPTTRTVLGMRVLESRETPGLGDKIYKDRAFVDSFRSLSAADGISLTKDGASKPNEVDAITGATISSRAVVSIIQRGVDEWSPRFETPPALQPDEAEVLP